MSNEASTPARPYKRVSETPETVSKNSATLDAPDCSICSRVITSTTTAALERGCSTLEAEITTGSISPLICVAACGDCCAWEETASVNALAKTAVWFFMRNKQVKRPHRLPRQCMGFTARPCGHATLLAGIRAGRCDLHRLPGRLFQGDQWLVR